MHVARYPWFRWTVSVAVLLSGSAVWAANGDKRKSDAVGGDATCVMHSDGPGFKVTCSIRDTKDDGNHVRLEWYGPGKSGKLDNRQGPGTAEPYTIPFPIETGEFRFKAVVDRGVVPDSVGAEKKLVP